ncbi:leucyl aminopeptidase family protein [Octadecabacter sp. 1_MG-2023]|uniref:leucyl aminopeptidase family protein n=1 Tax=unclassified Octadecabacter TaxID=196158 RepID=UPI001C0922E1|nr:MULTISPECIES: leucyl aminopeptidase family protein [unclassified Octadecabacter]MBU2992498.1 leucyl aminopeptidase family protein [Octadecabacter sp. B2R22]MDO6734745.1 leucyl aminopeptidase family protein [Octadecabacter sp. 1_MG-2023]
MSPKFAAPSSNAIQLMAIYSDDLEKSLAGLPAAHASWLQVNGFDGGVGSCALIANDDGHVARAFIGLGARAQTRVRFAVAAGAVKLPTGIYALEAGLSGTALDEAAFGLLMSTYRFDRYKTQPSSKSNFTAPAGVDATRIEALVAGECLTRDLINTPASDMGPQELETAARDLAKTHGADCTVIQGDELLDQNFPLIHTVGRASPRVPRLIDMTWGTTGPSLTLVGKGVCFDTGGLNLKPGASMGLMKKDMGGAATVLGLAHMIMALKLDIKLRVLIPAVENSVDGSAFRPGDVLTSRKGMTVEINNTDAEGRLVLADALALADEGKPDHIISMATLTGAARVAVGPDLAPFYTTDDAMARALPQAASEVADPVWQMPFHDPYERMIEPQIADLDNAPAGGFAGSITAALFLRRFVSDTPYTHFDIYGWNPVAAPARPKGGAGQGARAVLAALPEVLGL